jgi:hypothetical protein
MATTKNRGKTPANSKARRARRKPILGDLDPGNRADGIKGGLGQLRGMNPQNGSVQSSGTSTTS